MAFAPPLSPFTARRPRLPHSFTTTRNPSTVHYEHTTTMLLNDGLKRRLGTGFSALTAAIALSLTRVPGVIIPDITPPVALATSFSATKPTSLATVLVARQSLQDLCDQPTTTPTNPNTETTTTTNMTNIQPSEDGEFALSVRLCTACALGVLMGSEMGATALALGMRALVVISLTSCLATIYAILPPGAETTFLPHVVPPFVAPFVASGVALLGLFLFTMLQPKLSTRRRSRRQRITRSAMTCGVVASAAGTGAACAAGQALPAVMFYLIALAICRSVPLPKLRSRRNRNKRALARELIAVASTNGSTSASTTASGIHTTK